MSIGLVGKPDGARIHLGRKKGMFPYDPEHGNGKGVVFVEHISQRRRSFGQRRFKIGHGAHLPASKIPSSKQKQRGTSFVGRIMSGIAKVFSGRTKQA
jgi:hypothetical protein